jgi:ferritin-like metal-binding protein YciE
LCPGITDLCASEPFWGPGAHFFKEESAMPDSATDLIRRYLEDVIAAEKSFETQLNRIANDGDDSEAKALFSKHARETRSQYERLTERLEALGGSTSAIKSFFAHVFGLSPKTAQIGHEEQERTTQNLIMAFSIENAECAMYEALATTALAAGDEITARLATQIQAEEKKTADEIWKLISPSARYAFARLTELPLQRSV